MGASFFDFKAFRIYHDRCAMKVGTDGVLLGAWATMDSPARILDIGTGSGLIAILLAQHLPESRVDGIDVDADAVVQACENVERTPWKHRIGIRQADVRTFCPGETYDLVVSNPPFFDERVLPGTAGRRAARHTDQLPHDALLDAVVRLLAPQGRFCVVLPADRGEHFAYQAWEKGLHLCRKTEVCTKVGKPPKRVLMAFGRCACPYPVTDRLDLTDENGVKTARYAELTRDIYLR